MQAQVTAITATLGTHADRIDALESVAQPAPWAPRFALDVPQGSIRLGAAIGGNAVPAAHESVTGVPLAMRRTFWGWHHRTTKLPVVVAEDHAAGRTSWVSIKTPHWGETARGDHDAELDQLMLALADLGIPVWLTPWHEPENDSGQGTPADWVAMQERFAARAPSNVTVVPIVMSWTTFAASGRDPEEWTTSLPIVGVDFYNQSEGRSPLTNDTLAPMVDHWVGRHGKLLAFGEFGNRGTDTGAGDELDEWVRWCVANDVLACCWFDSDLNSPSGGWTLQGEPLTRFRQWQSDPICYR
jgi:hypothetical protein